MREVFENRAVNELVQRARLGSSQVPQEVSFPRLLERIRAEGFALVEEVVGLAHRAEILVRPGDDGQLKFKARVTRLAVTEERDQYVRYRERVESGARVIARVANLETGDTDAGTDPVPGPPLDAAREAGAKLVEWAKAESGGLPVVVIPDGYLHDLPWAALGQASDVDIVGQALSSAALSLNARASRPSVPQEAVVVLNQEIMSHADSKELMQPLERAGWNVRILIVDEQGPEWADGSAAAVSHPQVVFWLTHGGRPQTGSQPELQLPYGGVIRAQELIRSAAGGKPLELASVIVPGEESKRESIRLGLGSCHTFVSGACMSGAIDPRHGHEAVGLVRAVLAFDVEQLVAPNYEALLGRVPGYGLEEPYQEFLRAVVAAVAEDRPIGESLTRWIRRLQRRERVATRGASSSNDRPSLEWWWSHATVWLAGGKALSAPPLTRDKLGRMSHRTNTRPCETHGP
jgi:hypothetical protein